MLRLPPRPRFAMPLLREEESIQSSRHGDGRQEVAERDQAGEVAAYEEPGHLGAVLHRRTAGTRFSKSASHYSARWES